VLPLFIVFNRGVVWTVTTDRMENEKRQVMNDAIERMCKFNAAYIHEQLPGSEFTVECRNGTMVISPTLTLECDATLDEDCTTCIQCKQCGLIGSIRETVCEGCNTPVQTRSVNASHNTALMSRENPSTTSSL
jgi:hypothetical protein